MFKKEDVDTWIRALKERPVATLSIVVVLLLGALAWRYATSLVDRLGDDDPTSRGAVAASSLTSEDAATHKPDPLPDTYDDGRSPAPEPSSDASSPTQLQGFASPGAPPEVATVRATGIGFPPPHVAEPERRRALARRAAEAVALRDLAEQIRGALVIGTTSVAMATLTEDEVKIRVNGLVRLSKVVEERMHPDGSVEVTMEAPLRQER